MMTVYEAFDKFRRRLELTETEQADATSKHTSLSDFVKSKFEIDKTLLTGSYARDTKTKPLSDVDIFCIFKDNAKKYRWERPEKVLSDFEKELASEYGSDKVKIRRRSVMVTLDDEPIDDSSEEVLSFDIVPAYTLNQDFEIPDFELGTWIKTNPFVHASKATEANKNYTAKWKPLVKMIKTWNRNAGKPVSPSFLLEVMALQIIVPPAPSAINYPYELKAFFATAINRIGEEWADPAGLGPPVSDQMDSTKINAAIKALTTAEETATRAIMLEKAGNIGAALAEWQSLFGSRFSMS